MFTIEYRGLLGSSQTQTFSNDITEFAVPSGFTHDETNTDIKCHLTVLKLLATHATVGKDGNRTIVFRGIGQATIFHLAIMIWIIFCYVLEYASPIRVSFIIYVMFLHVITGLVFLAEPYWVSLNRVFSFCRKGCIQFIISIIAGVPNDVQLTNLCKKHDYNKLAVLRELLK